MTEQAGAIGPGVDWRTSDVRVVPPHGRDANTSQTTGNAPHPALEER